MSAVQQSSKTILIRVFNRPNQVPLASLSTTSTDNGSDVSAKTEPRRRPQGLKDGINMATLKKGPGYRSSFSGTVATVFGATGAVGRGVCARFGKNGTQMIIPYRGDFYDAQRLKVCGDLGQVLFQPYDVRDEESIRKAMKYSDVVVNLIGREYETRNFNFHDVNVKIPAKLARIAKEMGVQRFIHISSINASDNPQTLFMPGGSPWLKTKREGERAVFKENPDATIIRPCEIYGYGDHMVNYYNCNLRKAGYKAWTALWKKGNETVRSPLFINDLTSGIMACLADPGTRGETFEAMGPEQFLLADLVDWMHDIMDKDEQDFGYSRQELMFSPATFAKATACSLMPFGLGLKYFKACTLERLERSQLSEISEGLPSITDLGVNLHRVEEKMPWELDKYRAFKYFDYPLAYDRLVPRKLVALNPYEAKSIINNVQDKKTMQKLIGL